MSDTPTPAQDVAGDYTQGTEAPRYAPNCKHAYMNDGFDCPFCLRDRLAQAERDRDEARKELDKSGLDAKIELLGALLSKPFSRIRWKEEYDALRAERELRHE